MKTKLMVLTALLLCSCQKDNFYEDQPTKGSIVATTANEDTKTTVDGLNVTWNADDKINIAYNNSGVKNKTYTLDPNYAGKKQGLFEGESIPESEICYAFYPASNAGFKNGVKYEYTIPSSQDVKYGAGYYLPMYTHSFTMTDKNIPFNHLAAVLEITVNPNGEKLIKNIEVKIPTSSKDGYPSKSFTIINGELSSTSYNAQSLTLNINETISEPKTYSVVVAPKISSYTWKITLSYGDGSAKEATFTNAIDAGKRYTGTFNL